MAIEIYNYTLLDLLPCKFPSLGRVKRALVGLRYANLEAI